MKSTQAIWTQSKGWIPAPARGSVSECPDASLVLLFGGRSALSDPNAIASLVERWPKAILFGCSTAGEIHGSEVADDTLVATAVEFAHTRLQVLQVPLAAGWQGFEAGVELAKRIDPEGLTHVLILSDGLAINGSELVKGLTQTFPEGVVVTGGLAGDGSRFEETLVVANRQVNSKIVAALAFYGERLRVGCGSLGGWDQFGLTRRVTKSEGNILYELDGKSALGLYKEYLGDHAASLPSSGLLFPLAIRPEGAGGRTVVRTILGVDEATQSLRFAGDVPNGWDAQLMRANFDRLIDGAHGAAEAAMNGFPARPGLVLLVSCVGRKLILNQRVEEEIEAVRDVVGPLASMTGFYSYGEIGPFTAGTPCELHNQTMSVTVFQEV